MSTLHLLANHFLSAATCVPTVNAPCPVEVIKPVGTETITNVNQVISNLQSFVGPIFLAIVGFFAITFLMKKKMKDFIAFIALAIVIAVIFYTPGIIHNLATMVAGLFGS